MALKSKRFSSLSDAELIDLLFTAGDRLPREAVDEILCRGERMLPHLRNIVSDKTAWTQPLPDWWAVVHATYILGTMASRDLALLLLLTALRWADAFDCDWVTEDLPSIFAYQGSKAYEPLSRVARDPTAGPGARSIALAAMAAVAVEAPFLRGDVVAYAANIVSDCAEEYYFRQTAANLMLDFCSDEHRDLLVAFGQEEAFKKRADPEYRGVFYDWEVDELLRERGGKPDLEYYGRDWLDFYEPDEIEARQERWQREQDETQTEQLLELHAARSNARSLCPCGSGRSFSDCCYLKVH